MTAAQRAIKRLQDKASAIEPTSWIQEDRKRVKEATLRQALREVEEAERPPRPDGGVVYEGHGHVEVSW